MCVCMCVSPCIQGKKSWETFWNSLKINLMKVEIEGVLISN